MHTLYHGDCLAILPTLEPQSVDAVICDPPYGTTACKWDSIIPFAPMWEGIKRVLKPRGAVVLFGSQPFTSALVMSNPAWFRYEWVWRKNFSTGFANAHKQPLRNHENILVFYTGSGTYNPVKQQSISAEALRQAARGAIRHRSGKQSAHTNIVMVDAPFNGEVFPTTVQDFDCVPRQHVIHDTQKPLALLEYLVRTYTDPGDTVLDFTMGSGTTGHACMNLGRAFVGIEQDAAYFAIAQARIDAAAATRQMSLEEAA